MAVKVVVKTLLREQSTTIAVAENETGIGTVCANVNLPPAAVVTPIETLFSVPAVAGLTVTVPVPVGLKFTVTFADVQVSEVNTPVFGVVAPTVPLCGPENCVLAVIVVPLMVFAAVPPIAGGEAR